MWYQKAWFKYLVGAVLLLLAIKLYGEVQFFIEPLLTFLTTMLTPILLAGILYYILRPVVRWLSQYIWRSLSILIIFVVIVGAMAFAITGVGGFLTAQFQDLVNQWPIILAAGEEQFNNLLAMVDFNSAPVTEIRDNVLNFLQNSLGTIGNNVFSIAGAVTSAITVAVVIPFILFYLLKDDHKVYPSLLKWSPRKYENQVGDALREMDGTVQAYVLGQMLVATVIGVLMFCGYLLIGLPFAAVLALFALVTSFIPFLGPFLGILPAIVIAIPDGTFMIVKVLIVFVIVQQSEGNLVSPKILGDRLNIHPVTVILIILAMGSVFGFIGILLAVPLYAVIKVAVNAIISGIREARNENG
ncbi:AI-2E family transporter [Aureibacillus halotolerans]|uniref:Putative PurR-regulated permease PerM n=1 Tax=Aureibacillus halotolerans TaxID=1508390 RepID=A0A4R6UB68_9BACI|nr:AI-2E family transporter [Aureibacillus halotolerans]TDQ40314.1 putative PurR-regulated permease PerM [Aureibacillus halotolerans]